MILVDSSVWIDYFNGNKTAQTDWLDSSLGNTPIIMGDLILTEVLQGFQNDRDFRIARDLLLRLAFMPMGGQALALESATNYKLRQLSYASRSASTMFIRAARKAGSSPPASPMISAKASPSITILGLRLN